MRHNSVYSCHALPPLPSPVPPLPSPDARVLCHAKPTCFSGAGSPGAAEGKEVLTILTILTIRYTGVRSPIIEHIPYLLYLPYLGAGSLGQERAPRHLPWLLYLLCLCGIAGASRAPGGAQHTTISRQCSVQVDADTAGSSTSASEADGKDCRTAVSNVSRPFFHSVSCASTFEPATCPCTEMPSLTGCRHVRRAHVAAVPQRLASQDRAAAESHVHVAGRSAPRDRVGMAGVGSGEDCWDGAGRRRVVWAATSAAGWPRWLPGAANCTEGLSMLTTLATSEPHRRPRSRMSPQLAPAAHRSSPGPHEPPPLV